MRIGTKVNFSFSRLNASLASGPIVNRISFFVRSVSGDIIRKYPSMKYR